MTILKGRNGNKFIPLLDYHTWKMDPEVEAREHKRIIENYKVMNDEKNITIEKAIDIIYEQQMRMKNLETCLAKAREEYLQIRHELEDKSEKSVDADKIKVRVIEQIVPLASEVANICSEDEHGTVIDKEKFEKMLIEYINSGQIKL